jgi:dolichol-phosphate mannosyltransferase
MKVSIIIPAYNEEKNVAEYEPQLMAELKQMNKPWEIIFVDDGSTDKTLHNMNMLKRKYASHVKIIIHRENKGLGTSLRDGIKAAHGSLIIPLDADLTFHPKDIHKLIECYQENEVDVVIGSHFSKRGETKNIPLYRLFLSRTVNYIYQLILGQKIASMSSIFRLYKAEDIKKLDLQATGFDINTEILFQLIKKKKKILEVPVTLSVRKHGISKINIKKEVWNHMKMLSKILWWRIS